MKEIQRPCDFHQPGKKTPELTRAATVENKEDQCETEESGDALQFTPLPSPNNFAFAYFRKRAYNHPSMSLNPGDFYSESFTVLSACKFF